MSYQTTGKPNGVLYIGNVKWSNDYTNVMLFNSIAARNAFMIENLRKEDGKIIYINPNRYIDINGNIAHVENANYIFYKNDDSVTPSYFCCFITSFDYIAPNTTRLYLELDVFQMYHYTTNYYQSFIDRAIISKAADNQNLNYLPEPVSAELDYERKLSDVLTATDWGPVWVLHSASYYDYDEHVYKYGGIGTNNTYGEYGRFIESQAELIQLLENYGRKSPETIAADVSAQSGNDTWVDWVNSIFAGTALTETIEAVKATTSIADLQDHRQELIGMYAIPKWLKDNFTGDSNYADNRRTSVTASLSINAASLANGYTPRNKKMLTSVCRAYVLANKTGMVKTFKPELFSGAPTLTLTGITMSTSGYQWQLSNYADIQNSFDEVSYNSERRVGYDANTGLNKVINTIGAAGSVAASLGGIAGGVATGNPVTAISGAGSAATSLVRAIDTIGQKEQHFGHNGDLLRITGGRAQLSWYEVSPTLSECQMIDNFFDMYGYTIQKHQSPVSYMNNRPVWNYLKTANINLQCKAPADQENRLKDIFNAGVTIWHDYTNFGNYSAQNW